MSMSTEETSVTTRTAGSCPSCRSGMQHGALQGLWVVSAPDAHLICLSNRTGMQHGALQGL